MSKLSRAEELAARYGAELAVVRLEDELAERKATVERCGECGRRKAADDPDLRALKLELREARRVQREQREGGAVVSPATVEVSAGLPAVGGAE